MLKIALAGVGGISGAHIPAWEAMEDAELVALCDIRPEQMEKYPDKRHYTDFDEMLEREEIDILDICLPTYLHADYAVKAMKKGINVICEKPVSLKREDVARVYGAAKKNSVKFMIAQVLRFWPEYEVLKRIYDEKTYGRLLSGNMRRLGCYPKWSWDDWMLDEARSGLIPFDLHIHDLDFCVYAFGAPTDVQEKRVKLPKQDYISAVYQFPGFFITTESSWYSAPYPFTASFRFLFEKALVAWEGGKCLIYQNDGQILDLSTESQNDTGDIDLPQTNAYAEEIRYFKDCVKEGRFPDKVKPEVLKQVLHILNAL